jgi:dihydroxyacetone kinase-like protein
LAIRFRDAEEELNELDRAVGDGDHGSALARGFLATVENSPDNISRILPGEILIEVARKFANAAGGASGLLFSVIFKELGLALKMNLTLDSAAFAKGLNAASSRVTKVGKVKLGDKTMFDALHPASVVAQEFVGEKLSVALLQTSDAARKGAKATIDLVAKKGRGRYVENGGLGHIDPGAQSISYIIETLRLEHDESR